MSKRSDDLVFETAGYRDDAHRFKKMLQRNKLLVVGATVGVVVCVFLLRWAFF